jgi:hypothetical protein
MSAIPPKADIRHEWHVCFGATIGSISHDCLSVRKHRFAPYGPAGARSRGTRLHEWLITPGLTPNNVALGIVAVGAAWLATKIVSGDRRVIVGSLGVISCLLMMRWWNLGREAP